MLNVFFSNFKRRIVPKSARRSAGTAPSWRIATAIESLETRVVLSAIHWDGESQAINLDWNDPINWSGDLLPTANDEVTIGAEFQ